MKKKAQNLLQKYNTSDLFKIKAHIHQDIRGKFDISLMFIINNNN